MSAYIPGQGLPPVHLASARPHPASPDASNRTIPTALPPGSTPSPASSQLPRDSARLRGTNTPPTSSTEIAPVLQPTRRRHRIDRDELQRISAAMPERDRAVLRAIERHRYLTTRQIQSFVFTGHGSDESASRTARYVLARLDRLALITSLPRRVGGVRGGSAARIWQLAPAGARLLRDDGQTYRTHEPSLRFLRHCLAVADVHLGLRALGELDAVETVDVAAEPDCWRHYVGPAGERRLLQPDLAAVLRTREYIDRWFVEVDLGTESIPTVLKKCGQYEAYRASGIEQADHKAFPLVIWIFSRPERAETLRASILRSPRLTPELYRLVSTEQFADRAREWLQ